MSQDGRNGPIKTLLFSTLFPSSARPTHGLFVETRLRQLLASREIATTVLAPVPWFPFKASCFGVWSAMAATPRREIRHGIEIAHPRYPLPPRIGMSLAPWLLAVGVRAGIRRMLAEGHDFDLIDAHYYYPDGAAAALLSRWFNRPFVVTARGSDLNVLPDYALPRRWIKWTEAQAAASILVSRPLHARLRELGGDPQRMHVLPNGVDLEFFRPLDRGECRRRLGIGDDTWLLSVGNLVALKGHEIAIDALERLGMEYRLAIVGHGPDRERLMARAERLGLADRVRFTGPLPQETLVAWYSAADALVHCSSREGSPNVVLEALACGTRVIATAVGGIPDMIESPTAGRLLPQRTAEAVADAVRMLAQDAVQREAVREYASRFDWNATTRGQLELFRTVVRSQG